MLPPSEKTRILEQIISQLERVKKSIASLQEQTRPIPLDGAIGRVTRMDAIQQKSMSEANLRTAEEQLHKLEEAMAKVEDPEFGLCTRCHKPIPVERLLALPGIQRCVHCAGRL